MEILKSIGTVLFVAFLTLCMLSYCDEERACYAKGGVLMETRTRYVCVKVPTIPVDPAR